MDLGEWAGLAVLIAYLGFGYLRVRADRRSGATHSFGHPALDNVLLLASALLLVAFLGLALWLVKESNFHSTARHLLFYVVMLSLGGLLTWLCNRILRRSRRRR